MTLKLNLLIFFRKRMELDRLNIDELSNDFSEITDYVFTTATQFQYFKKTLLTSKFMFKESKTVFRFNWEKIIKVFPELAEELKKVRQKK